jgi:hypothetical protein
MDDKHEIKKSLKTIYNFSDEQLDIFIFKLSYKKIIKKEHLLKPSQKCCFMAFITKGSFRFYSLTESEEPTLHFFFAIVCVRTNNSTISSNLSKETTFVGFNTQNTQ